jgi:hypothetical protein
MRPTRKLAAALVPAMVAAALVAAPEAAATNLGANGPIVYEQSGADFGHDLMVMNADGSGVRQLTFTANRVCAPEDPDDVTNNKDPAWAPNGNSIAFLGWHPEGSSGCRQGIYTIAPDGTDLRRLALMPVGMGGLGLAWSPDGSRLAVGSTRGLWLLNADGSSGLELIQPAGVYPDWSPDGSRLAYSTAEAVWTVRIDGSDPQELVELSGTDGVSWSPDGAKLAMGTDGRLAVVDADGTDFRWLDPADALSSYDSFPVWSPDGTKIIFGRFTGTSALFGTDLWMMNADGSAPVELTPGGKANWYAIPRVDQPVGLVDPATGLWHLARSDGSTTSFYYGNPGDLPILGDWDGDGTATPGLYRQSDGFFYSRNSNTTGVADAECFAGDPSDVPIAGDWDGDGDDNLGIYRPSEQRFYLYTSTCTGTPMGAAQISFLFGNPGDKPVAGDWDGDGIDEVGLHRESTGFFYWRNTLDTGVADGEIFFGDPGDRFVAGDWGTGDGKDTPGLFRPSDVTFYFRHTLTQGVADSQFTWTGAGSSWLPVAGDFGLG